MSGEERMVIVQLRCVIFHYLLRMLHGALVKLGPPLVCLLPDCFRDNTLEQHLLALKLAEF
jgi:hypothetical protein